MSDLDMDVAVMMGWRFFSETRGEYTLAIGLAPDRDKDRLWGRNTLKATEEAKKRYREITGEEAQAIGFFGEGIPPYSSSIAHAFEVVEKMRERGWGVDVGGSPKGRWTCMFSRAPLPSGREGIAEADTVPEAICRAALQAVEQEEKG